MAYYVIAGLDPAIHHAKTFLMDARVEAAHDETEIFRQG